MPSPVEFALCGAFFILRHTWSVEYSAAPAPGLAPRRRARGRHARLDYAIPPRTPHGVRPLRGQTGGGEAFMLPIF